MVDFTLSYAHIRVLYLHDNDDDDDNNDYDEVDTLKHENSVNESDELYESCVWCQGYIYECTFFMNRTHINLLFCIPLIIFVDIFEDVR